MTTTKIINKTEFIDQIATFTGESKAKAERLVEGFIDTVTKNTKAGNKVNITGFGSFSVRVRKARSGINPKTKAPIKIAESKSVGFKAGKTLKDAVS